MKRMRAIIGLLLLISFICFFIYYVKQHHELLSSLSHVSPARIGLLYVLYLLFFVCLALITYLTALFCGIRLNLKTTALLTAYSSLINFFGPLQSGPGARFVYLRRQHKIKTRRFINANLLYYAAFALISAMMLLGGSLAWWLSVPIVIGLVGLAGTILHKAKIATDFRISIQLGLATLAQLAVVGLIYFTELRAVMPTVNLHQALVYTGAANFALFVSLTPGAIGIRESFLLLAQRLHHLPSNVVISASLLDRAMYLVMLASLLLLTSTLHAGRYLRLKKADRQSAPEAPPVDQSKN